MRATPRWINVLDPTSHTFQLAAVTTVENVVVPDLTSNTATPGTRSVAIGAK